MEDLKKKFDISNFLFILGWSLFMISYIFLKESELMYMYNTSDLYKVMKFIFVSIFTMKIIFVDKYNFKLIMLYLIILGLTLFNSIIIDTDMIFFAFLVAFSAKKINFKNFVKVDMSLRIFLVVTIILLSIIGVLPNFVKEINGSVKQGFGFSHPNILCLNIITILLEYMYICKKISIKYICINLLVIVGLSIICNARTSIYAYLIIFCCFVLNRNKDKIFKFKIVKGILCVLPIIMLSLSMILIMQYHKGNKTVIKLDDVFTTRISNGYKFYDQYGVKPLGSKIETVGTRKAMITGKKSNILDMGYLRVAICNGLIVCILFVVVLSWFQILIYSEKDFRLLLISTFFIMLGLLETNIYNIAFNFTFIAIMSVLNNNHKKGLVENNVES